MQANLNSVDPDWYVEVYPVARLEIEEGHARDAADHYERFGVARGYAPNLKAARYSNEGSREQGLWLDESHAEAELEHRVDNGSLRGELAAPLSDFIRDGYCIVPSPFPGEVLEEAAAALDRIYAGEENEARFSGPGQKDHWTERTLTHPAKALDTHMISPELRKLVLHDAVSDFLAAAFDMPALASQTLAFWRGSQQALHQDLAFVTYSQPLQFIGVWIALEDVQPESGELEYAVGSHTLPFYRFGESLSVHEARRLGAVRPDDVRAEKKRYEAWLRDAVEQAGLEMKTFRAKKGDVLFWHSALAHGGRKISQDRTRKSIVTHFCPTTVVPTYFERKKRVFEKHSKNAYFSSGIYNKIVA